MCICGCVLHSFESFLPALMTSKARKRSSSCTNCLYLCSCSLCDFLFQILHCVLMNCAKASYPQNHEKNKCLKKSPTNTHPYIHTPTIYIYRIKNCRRCQLQVYSQLNIFCASNSACTCLILWVKVNYLNCLCIHECVCMRYLTKAFLCAQFFYCFTVYRSAPRAKRTAFSSKT